MWNDRHCCCEQNRGYGHESSGIGALLFAMLMFVGMAISFSIALVALHLWFLSRLILRLMEGKWFRAVGWLVLLIMLLWADGMVLGSIDLS